MLKKIVWFILWLFALPASAQSWQEEVTQYLEKEGDIYEAIPNKKSFEKWLKSHISLDTKKLPHEAHIIGVDSNMRGFFKWVEINQEVKGGVVWVNLIVGGNGKVQRVEIIKPLPIFDTALTNALCKMTFSVTQQPFHYYFIAVAFTRKDNYVWDIEVL